MPSSSESKLSESRDPCHCLTTVRVFRVQVFQVCFPVLRWPQTSNFTRSAISILSRPCQHSRLLVLTIKPRDMQIDCQIKAAHYIHMYAVHDRVDLALYKALLDVTSYSTDSFWYLAEEWDKVWGHVGHYGPLTPVCLHSHFGLVCWPGIIWDRSSCQSHSSNNGVYLTWPSPKIGQHLGDMLWIRGHFHMKLIILLDSTIMHLSIWRPTQQLREPEGVSVAVATAKGELSDWRASS